MIEIRPFGGLGHADHGWLNARHHFSFADYHEPTRMGWGAIRVWNDDEIAPRHGFPPHHHRDMEIVTYVRKGAISHRDSLGGEGRTPAGDVQVMSAGTGIHHAEYNLEDETTSLFQIWIMPDAAGGEPHWGQRAFPVDDRAGRWVVLASGMDDVEGALPIRANARILGASIKAGETLHNATEASRHLYLVAAAGRISVDGLPANARDGVAITGLSQFSVHAYEDSELVLVDAR